MPRSLGIGVGVIHQKRAGPIVPAILLSGATAPENMAAGATIGTLNTVGTTGTPTFALDTNDGNRVALSGSTLQRGATALNFEDHPTLSFTVSVSGVTPAISPRLFNIAVTNVLEVAL